MCYYYCWSYCEFKSTKPVVALSFSSPFEQVFEFDKAGICMTPPAVVDTPPPCFYELVYAAVDIRPWPPPGVMISS